MKKLKTIVILLIILSILPIISNANDENPNDINPRTGLSNRLTNILESTYRTKEERNKSTNDYFSDDRVVYVTKNGSKFHKSGCEYLNSTPHKMTVLEASNQGYAPCKVCKSYGLSLDTTEKKEKKLNINIIIPLFFIVIIALIIYIVFNEKRYYKVREYSKKKS